MFQSYQKEKEKKKKKKNTLGLCCALVADDALFISKQRAHPELN